MKQSQDDTGTIIIHVVPKSTKYTIRFARYELTELISNMTLILKEKNS